MARLSVVIGLSVVVVIAIGAQLAWAQDEGDAQEAAPHPEEGLPTHPIEEGVEGLPSDLDHNIEVETDEEGNPVENPNYAEDLKRLIKLCKTIKDEMHEVFLLKDHHKQETGIMAHASTLGSHLEHVHQEDLKKPHHEWTCAEARAALKHEHAQNFVDHFENWYNGKDLVPPVSHAKAVALVTHLREELTALRLTNDETAAELTGIITDLNELEKWHLALRASYDEMMHDKATDSCEKPFQEFVKVLHTLHADHVPEWYHVSEGVNLLLDQCKEDPEISGEL